MYYQYLPEIVKKVEIEDYDGVVEFALSKPHHYLPFLCADIYQSQQNPIDTLSKLNANLANKEGVEVDPVLLQAKMETLVNLWTRGSLEDQDAYDKVAKQLLKCPYCESVSFCAALLLKYDAAGGRDEWNMFRLGLLAGAFVKNEYHAGPDPQQYYPGGQY